MLQALLKIIGFAIFAFLLVFILYFHLSNSETLKVDFFLGQIETNVTSIILISLIKMILNQGFRLVLMCYSLRQSIMIHSILSFLFDVVLQISFGKNTFFVH